MDTKMKLPCKEKKKKERKEKKKKAEMQNAKERDGSRAWLNG
jgi:hypothetical protein